MLEVSDWAGEEHTNVKTLRFPVRLRDVLVLVTDYIQRGLLRTTAIPAASAWS